MTTYLCQDCGSTINWVDDAKVCPVCQGALSKVPNAAEQAALDAWARSATMPSGGNGIKLTINGREFHVTSIEARPATPGAGLLLPLTEDERAALHACVLAARVEITDESVRDREARLVLLDGLAGKLGC